jgi:hypothetical protein
MFGDVPLQLKRLARDLARDCPIPHLKSYAIAMAVVEFYLETNFGRIRAELNSPEFNVRQQVMRMQVIAQALFALRNQPGFEEFCRRFNERGHRSIYFEATSAANFQQAGFRVGARREASVLTEDFDFEVRMGDHKMAVEVTGLTSEQFSSSAFLRALNKKRRQLPADSACCLHCYYPAEWNVQNPKLDAEMDVVVAEFLRRSGRINYLTLQREEYQKYGEGFAWLLLGRTFKNLDARHDVGPIDARVGLALKMPDYTPDLINNATTSDWMSGEFQMFVDYVGDLREFNRRLAAGVYGGMPPPHQ